MQEGIPEGFDEHFAAWARIESRCRSNDWGKGLQARTADPLWMLVRQWQTGELQGEDAGSPILVSLTHSTQTFDRVRLGDDAAPVDLSNVPLEAFVEQERFELDWRARTRIGQQFERFARTKLDAQASILIDAYRDSYSLEKPEADDWTNTDRATRRFIELMTRRVIDGKKLLEAIDAGSIIPPTGVSQDQLEQVLAEFNTWYAKLHLQPVGRKSPAWRNQQLDYRLELNSPVDPSTDKTWVKAPEYRNGSLDWFSFLAENHVGDDEKWTQLQQIHTTPTLISVGGQSPRWWAFEDSATDFGRLDVAKPDLAKLLLMEFMLIYGDDWFSVPLPVRTTEMIANDSGEGELTVYPKLVRIDDMKVRNVFGEYVDVEPVRKPSVDPLLRWEMFSLASAATPEDPAASDVLFLPPVCGFREESPPIEEVRFLRDEGANMVWAVEHQVPNGLGQAVDGFDAQRERTERRRDAAVTELEETITGLIQELSDAGLTDAQREALQIELNQKREALIHLLEETSLAAGEEAPQYRLAATVPENWIPFVPANAQAYFGLPHRSIRLRRAQMLRNTDDELPAPVTAMSRMLDLSEDPVLWLEETAIPRAGLRALLTAQRLRWVDGKTYVWLGRKVMSGRGEGSSGLKFDFLESS
jgi:hypothetical protein